MWNLGSPLYGGDQELATSLGDVEQDGEAPPAGTKFDFATEGFIWDIFRRDWDDPVAPNDAFHFGGGADDGDQTGVYAVQTGLWCGTGVCDKDIHEKDDLEDADFIYVKGISSLTSNPSGDANLESQWRNFSNWSHRGWLHTSSG